MKRNRITIHAGASSDPGLVRPNNEDAFLIHPGVYAVADGMGGQLAGEVAASIAIQTLRVGADAVGQDARVVDWIHAANQAILRVAMEDPDAARMGTTLVAVVADAGTLTVAHIGDSRAYLFREGQLVQLTEDHSHVQELLNVGLITPNEAPRHPGRNLVTKALGLREPAEPDVATVQPHEGDRLLLCTDGLSGMISSAEISKILGRGDAPDETSIALVAAANAAGGRDNVTALVLDVVATDEEESRSDPTADRTDASGQGGPAG